MLALAIMSTAFTGQAIATGFERRYGVLKRLGATPLSRSGLMLAKTLAVLAVEVLQVAVIVAVALALGWRPEGSLAAAALLILLGTAAFSGLGLLMAGLLRAEATLAAANLVYLLLLAAGGVIFPLAKFPARVRPVLELLPISALTGGLRAVLTQGRRCRWGRWPCWPCGPWCRWAWRPGRSAGSNPGAGNVGGGEYSEALATLRGVPFP